MVAPFNGVSNGHPKSRKGSQRGSMQWGVYQANGEQRHTIIFLQDGGKTTDMKATTIRFQFDLHTYYPWEFFQLMTVSLLLNEKNNTYLAFHIGQWWRQRESWIIWNEIMSVKQLWKGCKSKEWSLLPASQFSSSIHEDIFTGQISKLGRDKKNSATVISKMVWPHSVGG